MSVPLHQRPVDGKKLRARFVGAGASLSTPEGRRAFKNARRAVLVQCDACGDKGSGTLNGNGRLTSVSLAASSPARGMWDHKACGGSLRPFDIEVAE